ncbi:MAG TPA: hypothetical protein VGI39_16510, partial [Polyangiaceae bacterium]
MQESHVANPHDVDRDAVTANSFARRARVHYCDGVLRRSPWAWAALLLGIGAASFVTFRARPKTLGTDARPSAPLKVEISGCVALLRGETCELGTVR